MSLLLFIVEGGGSGCLGASVQQKFSAGVSATETIGHVGPSCFLVVCLASVLLLLQLLLSVELLLLLLRLIFGLLTLAMPSAEKSENCSHCWLAPFNSAIAITTCGAAGPMPGKGAGGPAAADAVHFEAALREYLPTSNNGVGDFPADKVWSRSVGKSDMCECCSSISPSKIIVCSNGEKKLLVGMSLFFSEMLMCLIFVCV